MRALVAIVVLLSCAACRQDMHDQPKAEAFEASSFFADGRTARPLLEGTIARGELRLNTHLYTGKVGGKPATTFPFEITREHMFRGRERFEIFCTPCHDSAGSGGGMIVQRGMKRPSSFHIERLRDAPPGHYFDVITNGFGVMFDYADRIEPEDRWAIIAYIRALQLSQNANLDDVPAEQRALLEAK